MKSALAGMALGLAAAGMAFGQSDPLVSKSLPTLLSDGGHLWAFAADGSRYSRLDLFANPVAIRSGALPFKGAMKGGVGRTTSLLLFLNHRVSDTLTVSGIAALAREGKPTLDSLYFLRSAGSNNAINAGVELSALVLWRDTLVVGGGRAGFALARAKAEGAGALASDTLVFQALPFGQDTSVARLRCAMARTCRVDSLSGLTSTLGEPDSVLALAVDSSATDSVWLLIGTHAGLRRGLIGGRSFPRLVLPGDTGAGRIRIERLHADPRKAILWVFSGSRFWFSDDHGRTFRVPPAVAGVATKPGIDLKGFNPAPEAVNAGDTSFINFNLDLPGLVMFRRDSLLKNNGAGAPDDVLLDAGDGLDIVRGQGRLTSLAVMRSGLQTVVAAGTTNKGLFYRNFGAGASGEWLNFNSLKRLQGSLGEVITFPTLFQGTGPGGEPEYVQIGYRLKKDGKVTITVFNYAMEKVKTVVSGSRRKGGGSRSEKPEEDRWDGRDRSGRLVSVGTYYILVESDQGEKGWGKAISVRGRN